MNADTPDDAPKPDDQHEPAEPETPAAPEQESASPEATDANGAAPTADGAPEAPAEDQAPVNENMRWYIVKIASGREESIKSAIERRVKIEGLQDYFGEIVVPTEKVTEMVKGKRVVKTRKLFPGYLMAFVEFNDRILYLFRETSGVGDFVGGSLNKPPQPMPDHEVQRLLQNKPGAIQDIPAKARFAEGEHVKVKDGTFAGMEGVVKELLEAKGAVVVELTIFGRPVPVELEYWQVDYA
jgi:transcription termination/antitermination protein NusG